MSMEVDSPAVVSPAVDQCIWSRRSIERDTSRWMTIDALWFEANDPFLQTIIGDACPAVSPNFPDRLVVSDDARQEPQLCNCTHGSVAPIQGAAVGSGAAV